MAFARLLALLLIAAFAAFAVQPAAAADPTPRQTIDEARATLTEIDNALKAADLTDADLRA